MKKSSIKNRPKRFFVIMFNIIGIVFVVVLFCILREHKGYGFVFKMLQSNYEFISKYRNIPLHERYLSKLDNSYNIFLYVKSNTPSDAVIYLPGGKAFQDTSFGFEFKGEPYNKGWATRFLHPRKIVLESEYEKSSYSKDITHVMIVNKVGAEILPYTLDSIPVCAVLPMKPSVPVKIQ